MSNEGENILLLFDIWDKFQRLVHGHFKKVVLYCATERVEEILGRPLFHIFCLE